MKKKLIIIFLLIFSIFLNFNSVNAKTIRQLQDELDQQKQDLENNKMQTQKTEQQMAQINSNIESINNNIAENLKKIQTLNDEIHELEVKSDEKEDEIKEVISFLQIANSNNAYMEYIFGSQTITDLIFRSAISEQLLEYNNDLIDEYTGIIKESNEKKDNLEVQQVELGKQQAELEKQYAELGDTLSSLYDTNVSLGESIDIQLGVINDYKKLGCSEDEDLSVCTQRLNTIPPDSSFWRPLNSGSVTSYFGYRDLGDFHEGIDMSAGIGTPVYAVASGVVVATYAVGGTGNAVYVKHSVNGQRYSSIYMHLSAYNVSVGDYVTKDTVVGYSGNTGNSTGPHLHLGILTGHFGVYGDTSADYSLWSSAHYAHFIDPTSVINFPSNYGWFGNRTTYYH